MSWKDNPFGGIVSDGGTGWANGVFQGRAIRDMDDAINEWQQYAWSLERKLKVAEENADKWRALTIENAAQAVVISRVLKQATGKWADEHLGGSDKYRRLVNAEKSEDGTTVHRVEDDFKNVILKY